MSGSLAGAGPVQFGTAADRVRKIEHITGLRVSERPNDTALSDAIYRVGTEMRPSGSLKPAAPKGRGAAILGEGNVSGGTIPKIPTCRKKRKMDHYFLQCSMRGVALKYVCTTVSSTRAPGVAGMVFLNASPRGEWARAGSKGS